MNFSFLANKVSSTNITQPAQVKKDRKSSKKGQKVYLLPEHDHIEIQKKGLDRKKANNKFTEFQRLDRNAGDKEARRYADKYSIDVKDYTYSELEEKMGVSLMLYNKLGVLDYCSPQLKATNCVFYEYSETKMFMVKERSLRAFGNVFNKGLKKQSE